MDPIRSQCRYAPFYCEENVWHLAQTPHTVLLSDPAVASQRQVAIVTNRARTCALWRQRAAQTPTDPVVWDYHVILIVGSQADARVLDLDTTLEWPCPFDRYVDQTFRPDLKIPPQFRPAFRLLDAADYSAGFSSDRAHMRDAAGEWRAKPPVWPAIQPDGGDLPLARAIDVDQASPGQWLDLTGLQQRFSGAD